MGSNSPPRLERQ